MAAGAVQETVTDSLPRSTFGFDGAAGLVAGVVLFEGGDAGLVPAVLVAVTVMVYEVPLVSPVMVQVSAEVVQVAPPGVAVAV